MDGDGCLLVSKQGYTSCEITLGWADEPTLRYLQHKLGGSVKYRSGTKAIRWRLHHKPGMLDLLGRINGLVRHTARLKQLDRVCHFLDLVPLLPGTLHPTHGWFSGFFDAEGCLSLSLKGEGGRPQVTMSVSTLLRIDVEPFQAMFGGNISFDRGGKGSYTWSVHSQEDLFRMVAYFQLCPSRTLKNRRLPLIKSYYDLLKEGAWKTPGAPWRDFLQKWYASSPND